MDSLLFLIKKHNNNKTVRYNDKLLWLYNVWKKLLVLKLLL